MEYIHCTCYNTRLINITWEVPDLLIIILKMHNILKYPENVQEDVKFFISL